MHASCTHFCLFSSLESGYIVGLDVSLLFLCGCFGAGLYTLALTHFCWYSNWGSVHVDVLGVSLWLLCCCFGEGSCTLPALTFVCSLLGNLDI